MTKTAREFSMRTNGMIDFAHLEKYVSGDDALREEILGIFSEQVRLLLDQFDVFQPDEDWKNAAHTLKGASRGVGAWALGQICEDAEKLVGPAPAKREARATLLVSLRFLAHAALEETDKSNFAAA